MLRAPVRTLLALSVALAANACSDGSSSVADAPVGVAAQRIIGGTTSSSPSVGVVMAQKMCTGFLVSSNVVITAAHCFGGSLEDAQQHDAVGFYTGPGSLYTGPPPTEAVLDHQAGLTKHAVKSSGKHPSANLMVSPYTTDLGYVVLDTPLDATTFPPLPIRAVGATPTAKQTCTIIGYGMISIPTTDGTGLLRKEASVSYSGAVGTDFVVTYGTGTGYHGDSGGPLICNGSAFGAFSWIDSFDAPTTNPSRYAALDVAWVQGLIAANAPPAPPPSDAGTPPSDAGDAASPGSSSTGGSGSSSAPPNAGANGNPNGAAPGPTASPNTPDDVAVKGCSLTAGTTPSTRAPFAGAAVALGLVLARRRTRRASSSTRV